MTASLLFGSRPFVGQQRALPRRARHPRVFCFAPYTLTSLKQPIQHCDGGHRAFVPLLDPRKHSVPFAVALELHAPGGGHQQHAAVPAAESELYELRHLLAGCGQIVHAEGHTEQLKSGDSVLMLVGSGHCVADPHSPPLPVHGTLAPSSMTSAADNLAGCLGLEQGHPWSMASLVVYFHRSLLDEAWSSDALQHAQQHSSSGGSGSSGSGSSAFGSLTVATSVGGSGVVGLGLGAHPRLIQLLEQEWGGALQSSAGTPAAGTASSSSGIGSSGGDSGSPLLLFHEEPLQQQPAGDIQHQPDTTHLQQQPGATSAAASPHGVTKRSLQDVPIFQLPQQTNRLALLFDPVATPQVPPLVFGVECFESGHRTTPHVHPHAHELFFILSGEGTAFCGQERVPVCAGDLVVFSPGSVHGLDVDVDVARGERLYCLELMLPNEQFSELVRGGQEMGGLEERDLGVFPMAGCGAVFE